jgi:hypothetical protein
MPAMRERGTVLTLHQSCDGGGGGSWRLTQAHNQPQGHKVLQREIKGEDVGLDYTPIFNLPDQNFPPIISERGGG